jgi:glycosyltransferase involved in cell wall biosynthesis
MKIRVAFLVDYPHYIGGINYLNNLLEALASSGDESIIPYVFIGAKTSDSLKNTFRKNATIIESELFDRKSFSWLAQKLQYKIFGRLDLINKLMFEHRINVVSHSDVCGMKLPYKTINWLPDFQFLVMPKMFSWVESLKRNKLYKRSITFSDQLIVSSEDALSHLLQFYSVNPSSIHVLRFVSTVNPVIFEKSESDFKSYLDKYYGIKDKYFYCPNQFWKHKNHITLLLACKFLKDQGINIIIVFSGREYDFRHPHYFDSIKKFIAENGIQENVKMLGIIPLNDVYGLMRNCVSVINPSLFEGWSSTVEEVKSIGKNIILSDLSVHREQAPHEAQFFDTTNVNDLARCLLKSWLNREGGPDFELEEKSRILMDVRKKEYGKKYANCIHEVVRS